MMVTRMIAIDYKNDHTLFLHRFQASLGICLINGNSVNALPVESSVLELALSCYFCEFWNNYQVKEPELAYWRMTDRSWVIPVTFANSLPIGRFPGGSDGKDSACNVGDLGSIPGLGRSPWEGNGNPLQYSCLENPMDGGAWQATVHGVAKSQTWLNNFTFFHFANRQTHSESLLDHPMASPPAIKDTWESPAKISSSRLGEPSRQFTGTRAT